MGFYTVISVAVEWGMVDDGCCGGGLDGAVDVVFARLGMFTEHVRGVYGRRHLGDGSPVRQRFSDSAGNRVYVELDGISPAVRVKRKKLSRACCLWVYNLRLKHCTFSQRSSSIAEMSSPLIISCLVLLPLKQNTAPLQTTPGKHEQCEQKSRPHIPHPTSPSADPFTSIRHDAASRYSPCPPQRRFIAPTRTRIRMDNKRLTSFSSRLRSMYTNISGLGPLFPLST